MKPYATYDPKPKQLQVGRRGLLARLAKWLNKVRQEEIMVTLVASPRRPVRPWRFTVLGFCALALMSFVIGASLLSITINYQAKTAALNKQLQLAEALQAERDSLHDELESQEAVLVDLALQLRTVQTELEEVYALREQILEVLPPSLSQTAAAPSKSQTAVLPSGGAVSSDELMAWTKGTIEVSRKESSQLLTSMRHTYQNARSYRRQLDHTPSIWPAEGWVSSEFGSRIHPITGTRSTHNGIDIAALTGTEIVAAADGIVTHAGPNGGYGLTVIIDHDYGIETLYAHASSILVQAGEKVKRGQLIARVGTTGLSTGPHLHYEIRRNSQPINPREMLP